MLDFLNTLFAALGVNAPAALAAGATVIALVAWLKERGYLVPGFSVWKLTFSSGTITTLVVSLLVGGYAQYSTQGFMWSAILGGWLLTYLTAAGVYDGALALLSRRGFVGSISASYHIGDSENDDNAVTFTVE